MKRAMKSLFGMAALLVALAAVMALAGSVAFGGAMSLEGTKWTVKVTPDAEAAKMGEKTFDDTIVFDDGKISMTECIKAGFGASEYTCTPKDKFMNFETTQKSAKEGKNSWSGQIDGDAIKGTLVWTKKDGTVLHYSFEGKKAK